MPSEKRDYGLDLYRVLAMVFITTLHTVNYHFHMLDQENALLQFAFGNLVEIACYCGVDCFALLSGFLLADARWEYDSRWLQRIGNLWMKMLLWGGGMWGVLYVARRFGLEFSTGLSLQGIIELLFPMTYGWWYINAYMGLLVLLPLLMRGLAVCTSQDLFKVSCALFAGFSLIPVFTHSSGGIALAGGFSTIWLAVCFVWGYTLKKNEDTVLRIRRLGVWLWVGILLGIALPYCFSLFIKTHGLRGGGLLMTYLSPFCVIEAACLLVVCRKIRIERKWLQTTVAFISANSLGIYLFQNHPGIWTNFVARGNAVVPSVGEALWMIPCYVAEICAIGIICNYCIETLLVWIKMPQLIRRISTKLMQVMGRLSCQ